VECAQAAPKLVAKLRLNGTMQDVGFGIIYFLNPETNIRRPEFVE
jgi:hypothetical protein